MLLFVCLPVLIGVACLVMLLYWEQGWNLPPASWARRLRESTDSIQGRPGPEDRTTVGAAFSTKRVSFRLTGDKLLFPGSKVESKAPQTAYVDPACSSVGLEEFRFVL